jgi:hypothetical protein
MKLKTTEDIPSNWKRLTVRKKTTVMIRACDGVEEFKVAWSDKPLISNPDEDLIIIQPDGKEYPIKADVFRDTYEIVLTGEFLPVDRSQYIKKTVTTLVEIPEGVEAFEIDTLEGTIDNVAYPDYVAVGTKGELYTNTKKFVEDNLEIL